MLLPQTDRHVLLPQAVLELDLPAWVRPQDVSIVVLSGAGDMLALEAGAEGAGGGGGGGGGGCGGEAACASVWQATSPSPARSVEAGRLEHVPLR